MSDKFFVDTNVLVYAHDRFTGMKHRIARSLIEQLWESGEGVLSTQVLQELCVNLRRKVRHVVPLGEIRQIVRDYSTWKIVANTSTSIIEALEIEERYKISFWDALVVQAAEAGGASVLYSEDLAANQMYRGVRVLNPFA